MLEAAVEVCCSWTPCQEMTDGKSKKKKARIRSLKLPQQNAISIKGGFLVMFSCFIMFSSYVHHVFTMPLEDEIDVTACDCMLCCIKCHGSLQHGSDVQQGVHGNLLRIAAHLQMLVQQQLVLKGRR